MTNYFEEREAENMKKEIQYTFNSLFDSVHDCLKEGVNVYFEGYMISELYVGAKSIIIQFYSEQLTNHYVNIANIKTIEQLKEFKFKFESGSKFFD